MSARGKRPKLHRLAPDEFAVGWGDPPRSWRVMKRGRHEPFSEAELWSAIRKYFPPELLPAATVAFKALVSLAKEAKEAPAPKRGRGHPPGDAVGEAVEALMNDPRVPVDQRTARQVVAGRLWEKERPKVAVRGGRADFRAYDDAFKDVYDRVARLHQEWRRRKTRRHPPRNPE